MDRRHICLVLALIAVCAMAVGCAADHNILADNSADANLPGFWMGLWHGLILPFTFFVSLFNEHVGVYSVRNNGGWYNFGFVLGVGMIFGSGSGGASKVASHADRSEESEEYIDIEPEADEEIERE